MNGGSGLVALMPKPQNTASVCVCCKSLLYYGSGKISLKTPCYFGYSCFSSNSRQTPPQAGKASSTTLQVLCSERRIVVFVVVLFVFVEVDHLPVCRSFIIIIIFSLQSPTTEHRPRIDTYTELGCRWCGACGTRAPRPGALASRCLPAATAA